MRVRAIIGLLLAAGILSGCLLRDDGPPPEAPPEIPVTDSARPASGREIKPVNDTPIDPGRPGFGLGTCYSFEGKQTVALFFADDEESAWTGQEIESFTDSILLPALEFLMSEAGRWGRELSFDVRRYSSALSPELTLRIEGTAARTDSDLADRLAACFDAESAMDFHAALCGEYESQSVIWLLCFDKPGTSFTRMQFSEGIADAVEHTVLFADFPSHPSGSWKASRRRACTAAHELLHLFGAEDFYTHDTRNQLAAAHFPDDIIYRNADSITELSVGPVSAYLVGWTDKRPALLDESGWNLQN